MIWATWIIIVLWISRQWKRSVVIAALALMVAWTIFPALYILATSHPEEENQFHEVLCNFSSLFYYIPIPFSTDRNKELNKEIMECGKPKFNSLWFNSNSSKVFGSKCCAPTLYLLLRDESNPLQIASESKEKETNNHNNTSINPFKGKTPYFNIFIVSFITRQKGWLCKNQFCGILKAT